MSGKQTMSWQQVHEAVRVIFQGSFPRTRARELAMSLIKMFAFREENPQPYLGFAKSIEEAVPNDGAPAPTLNQWREAIRCIASNGQNLHTFGQTADSVAYIHARAFSVARAYRELKDLGYRIEVVDDDVYLPASEAMRLGIDIDKHVRAFGGRVLAEFMFRFLVELKVYVPEFKRWILTRKGAQLGQERLEPQNPYGYILHLAYKHFHVEGPGNPSDLGHIFKLAQLAVAITDVQPYSSIDGLYIDRSSLLRYLMEAVAFDSLISIEQFPARDARTFIEHLICQSEGDLNGIEDFKFGVVRDVALALLKVCGETEATLLRASDLGRELGKSQHNVRAALDLFFAQGKVNQCLNFPPLARDIDMDSRPLLQLANGDYWCPPQSLCGKATLEAFFQAMRLRDTRADSNIGTQIESLLIAQAEHAGMTVKTGHYQVSRAGQQPLAGQCDLVIESEKAIVFLEVKKKGLTRSARSGHDLQLLLDLTKGIAESQAQALRHQALLQEFGHLLLTIKGHPDKVVEWKDRRIIRASVVLFDYGSLHDRMTLGHFLRIACDTEFSTESIEHKEAVDDVNKVLKKLREHAERLGEMQHRFPFQDSVLLSVPQMLLLFRNSSSNATFIEELTRGERTYMNTKDFYSHYKFLRSLRD